MQASRNGVAVAPPQHLATFMEDEGVQLREQVPLAPYTTFGLGGKARYFVECGSEDEVRAALAYAAERRLPAYVLGGGSNVVFLDSGFPGLILRLTIGGMDLRDGPSPEVRAGAGVDWDTLVQNVVQRGWTGVECLSGIPGTVGGTPIQNVGAYGQEIAETLVSVACLDRTTLERRTFTARDCAFGYRDSRFKRADRRPYAWLVEHAGFPKGYRRNRGGAGISTHHALALVNIGGSSADLLALAEEVRDGVEKQFGIRLAYEPEVVSPPSPPPSQSR